MNAIATMDNDGLIPVIDGEIGGETQPCVDARSLHQWLKNGDRFATWIKKRIKTYGFIENEDFSCLSVITETQSKTVFGLMNQFNKASLEFDKFCDIASHAGRTLNLVGKQYKPQAKQRVDDLKKQIQPMFPNLEEAKDD